MLKHVYDRLRLLRRGDWLAVALAAVIFAIFAAVYSGLFSRVRSNFGFGRDWNCTYVGQGDPVCVKQPAKAAAR